MKSYGEAMNYPDCTEFTVYNGTETLKVLVRQPEQPQPLANRLLLLSIGMDRGTSLYSFPYRITADEFIRAGHFAASFDTPCHGERTLRYGANIQGLCRALEHGDDPFEQFIVDAHAIIEDLSGRGIVLPNRIMVCGASRGAYFAIRLLAEDARISIGAGFAPVTDWSDLSEFDRIKHKPMVTRLALTHYVDRLAGKGLFLAIGHRDTRVSTLSCCRFYTELMDKMLRNGKDTHLIDYYVTDDSGHTMDERWYVKASGFMLTAADKLSSGELS